MARANSGGPWFLLIFVILALCVLAPLLREAFAGRL